MCLNMFLFLYILLYYDVILLLHRALYTWCSQICFVSFFLFFSKLFVCFLFVFPPSIINSFSKKKILYYYYYYYRSILLFLAICITRVWSIQYNIVPPPSSSSILN
jgi:hypothetical protein